MFDSVLRGEYSYSGVIRPGRNITRRCRFQWEAVGTGNARRRGFMALKPEMETTPKIPLSLSKQLRTLAHDLSNSIETIMQASYLLGQATLDENNKRWLELIDNATKDAARINREIRDILRSQSESS